MEITKLDRIRNTEIRKELDVKELNKRVQKQLQWLKHLMQLQNHKQVTQIWQNSGKRKK